MPKRWERTWKSSTSPSTSPAHPFQEPTEGRRAARSGSNEAKRRGKWRELIKKVWEADPLICPDCQREMRIVSLIDERDVIAKMLKCLGLWQQGVRVDPQRQSGADPPDGDWVYEPIDQDPFPD